MQTFVVIGSSNAVSTLKTPGFVYFAQGDPGHPIKIGWATDPAKRLRQMQAHSPVILRLLHSELGNGRDEADLHKAFAAFRLHGEWFRADPEILAHIEKRPK